MFFFDCIKSLQSGNWCLLLCYIYLWLVTVCPEEPYLRRQSEEVAYTSLRLTKFLAWAVTLLLLLDWVLCCNNLLDRRTKVYIVLLSTSLLIIVTLKIIHAKIILQIDIIEILYKILKCLSHLISKNYNLQA